MRAADLTQQFPLIAATAARTAAHIGAAPEQTARAVEQSVLRCGADEVFAAQAASAAFTAAILSADPWEVQRAVQTALQPAEKHGPTQCGFFTITDEEEDEQDAPPEHTGSQCTAALQARAADTTAAELSETSAALISRAGQEPESTSHTSEGKLGTSNGAQSLPCGESSGKGRASAQGSFQPNWDSVSGAGGRLRASTLAAEPECREAEWTANPTGGFVAGDQGPGGEGLQHTTGKAQAGARSAAAASMEEQTSSADVEATGGHDAALGSCGHDAKVEAPSATSSPRAAESSGAALEGGVAAAGGIQISQVCAAAAGHPCAASSDRSFGRFLYGGAGTGGDAAGGDEAEYGGDAAGKGKFQPNRLRGAETTAAEGAQQEVPGTECQEGGDGTEEGSSATTHRQPPVPIAYPLPKTESAEEEADDAGHPAALVDTGRITSWADAEDSSSDTQQPDVFALACAAAKQAQQWTDQVGEGVLHDQIFGKMIALANCIQQYMHTGKGIAEMAAATRIMLQAILECKGLRAAEEAKGFSQPRRSRRSKKSRSGVGSTSASEPVGDEPG